MTRIYFGNVLQLIFQVLLRLFLIYLTFQLVLVLGFTPWPSVRSSQLLSIVSSFITIMKTTTEVITVKEDLEDEGEGKTVCQKIKAFFNDKLELLMNFFLLFPLLVSSAIFNIGTLALVIPVLGIYSVAFGTTSLFLNLTIFFLVPLPFNIDKKVAKKLDIPLPTSRPTIRELDSGILLSWMNLFILSCSIGEPKPHRTMVIFYIQLMKMLLNIIVLVYILICNGLEAEIWTVSVISGILIVCGIVFVSLTCNSSTTWITMRKDKRGNNEEEDEVTVEAQENKQDNEQAKEEFQMKEAYNDGEKIK